MNKVQPEDLRKLYGKNVKARRKDLGITQTVLAERLDVTPAYICQIEGGTSWPYAGTFAKMAEALGTSPSALLSSDEIFAPISP